MSWKLDERSEIKRKSIEEEHRIAVTPGVNKALEKIKEAADWIKISTNSFNDYLDKKNDYYIFNYLIKSHPNIISRVKNTERSGKFRTKFIGNGYPPTTVFEYKWVPAEEKERLGFDAIIFRHIHPQYLDRIKAVYSEGTSHNKIDILSIINHLIYKKMDVRWNIPEIFKISSQTGVDYSTVCSVMNEMKEKKFLVCAPITIKSNRSMRSLSKIACKLVMKEEEYNEIYSESISEDLTSALSEKTNMDNSIIDFEVLKTAKDNIDTKAAKTVEKQANSWGMSQGLFINVKDQEFNDAAEQFLNYLKSGMIKRDIIINQLLSRMFALEARIAELESSIPKR